MYRRCIPSPISSSSTPAPKSISTIRPPSSRITLCGLTSRCTRPRRAPPRARGQVEADQRRFAGAEGALLAHHLLQRAPANQLHPQADLALPSIRAVIETTF